MKNNCQINLKSIHNCRSYGPDKFGWTDAHTLNFYCLAHRKPARKKKKKKTAISEGDEYSDSNSCLPMNCSL